MLKAYDYSEIGFSKRELKNEELFNEEKRLAHDFVLSHVSRRKGGKCPMCACLGARFLFHRWDVDYFICPECYSIFVPIEDEIMEEYLALESLKQLRISSRYQEEAEKRRADMWEETLMWLKYRTFRYLGTNRQLDVIDYGNRFSGLSERIARSDLCGRYRLENSILSRSPAEDAMENNVKNEPESGEKLTGADMVLYMNQLQHEYAPEKVIKNLGKKLREGGLLFLNTRLSSGFDVLTLKGGLDNIFPYEHIMLPSKKGIGLLLANAGLEALEIATVGSMDIQYVLERSERIEDNNLFVKYMLQQADNATLMDFQKFLQKNGFSSFAQIVARRR